MQAEWRPIMNTNSCRAFQLTTTAAALLAAFGPAVAAEAEEVSQLAKPESTVSLGAGYVDKDGARFGQYTGMHKSGIYGLLDADVAMRNDATGTWLKFTGRSLGLDNRELRFEHNRQGDWGYYLDFSQTPRYEPFTVNTAVTGIGSANLRIPTVFTAGTPMQLKTKREAIGLGFSKWVMGSFDLQVRFRNEEKDGVRLFARGTTGGAGLFEFAPEPIHSTTRQIDVILGYTGQQLQLSGGYYGTAYDNKNTALTFTGGNAGLSTFNPIGLPPDNQSHQLHLAGGYNFTSTTRGNFKMAYTRASQNDAFILPTAAGVGRSDLGGRVDTTLLQMGVSARPLPKLSLLGNFRYEDRDDQTPIARYFTGATPTSTFNGDNEPRSIKRTSGKLEASYQLPMSFRLTGGVDYEEKRRSASPVRVVSQRDRTDETSYRVELRRSMSDTVTGALAYVHSDRTGSPFSTTVLNNGTAGSNLIAPIHLADRKRDKVRLSVNWNPIERLGLQFMLDDARDSYSAREALGLGPQKGKAQNYSVDGSYAFSEVLQATAWASRNDNRMEQATAVGAAAGQIWAAALRNRGDAFGVGVRGKPMARLEIGADLSYANMTDEYQQQAITGAARTSLPDVSTKLTSLKVFGKYAIQKYAGVRLDYIYDQFRTNDWTWTNFTYTDGTTLIQNPNQKVHFIGVTYYFRWQ
jgi:MtrB/PioB family decaheme-associated outer membrane protein